MSLWAFVAEAAIVVNVCLLVLLGYVWGRNYLQFRSKHTLGLLVFALLLLAENAMTAYNYLWHPALSAWWHDGEIVPTIVWQAQTALHVIETLALAFLAWVTWD